MGGVHLMADCPSKHIVIIGISIAFCDVINISSYFYTYSIRNDGSGLKRLSIFKLGYYFHFGILVKRQ